MCYSGQCKYENHNGDCKLPFSLLQEKIGYAQCGFIIPGQTEEDYKYLIQRQDDYVKEVNPKLILSNLENDEIVGLWIKHKTNGMNFFSLQNNQEIIASAEIYMIENWINNFKEYNESEIFVNEYKQLFFEKKKKQIRGFLKQGMKNVNLEKTLKWEK